MKGGIRAALQALGYEVVRSRRHPSAGDDLATATPGFRALIRTTLPFTMTSVPRQLAVYSGAQYVVRRGIPGALVECGVWRGGSMMMAAGALLEVGVSDRDLYLFDTFDGMPPPGELDMTRSGQRADELLRSADRRDPGSLWCVADLEDVRANMRRTGYPDLRVHCVRGRVEDTLPAQAPEQIALLRLDTDWYESTRHELIHLFPRISPGGVLIVDDFGHWAGARRAVEEFLDESGRGLLLVSLDETGVCAVVS